MYTTVGITVSALLLALANTAFLPLATAQTEKQDSKPQDGEQRQTLATTNVEGFQIDVVAVEDVRGQKMSIEFDTSRMEVKGSITEFGDSAEQRFGDRRNGGFGRGSVSGFAGGAVGGFGGSYRPPNFGMVLAITPVNEKNATVVEIGSRAAAYAANGELIDEYDIGPTIHHFQTFEQRYSDKYFLYFSNKKRGVPNLQRVTGELRVTRGEAWDAEFNGAKPQTKKTPGGEIKLTNVTQKEDGIALTIEFPLPTNLRTAKSPMKRFQSTLTNRSATQVWIVDDAGNRYQPQSTLVIGQGESYSSSFSRRSTFTQGGRSGRMSMRSSGGTGVNPPYQVSFAPLPEGRRIQSIHARMTDRTGDVKTIPFEIRFEEKQ